MKTITANEFEALRGLDNSEYGDFLTDPVWSWSVGYNCSLAPRTIPGVVSSLKKKGLVVVTDSGTEDACIAMTEEGVEVYAAKLAEMGAQPQKMRDRATRDANRIAPEASAYLALAGC